MGGNMRCEDDLTHQIMTILKANIKLKDCIDQGQPRDIIERLEIYLQVGTFASLLLSSPS